MGWQDQLQEIVEGARRAPSFVDWLKASGYADVPESITDPLAMRSVIGTLYRRYVAEQRRAA